MLDDGGPRRRAQAAGGDPDRQDRAGRAVRPLCQDRRVASTPPTQAAAYCSCRAQDLQTQLRPDSQMRGTDVQVQRSKLDP